MKKAKHFAEEYGEKAVNKVKSVRDEGKRTQLFKGFKLLQIHSKEKLLLRLRLRCLYWSSLGELYLGQRAVLHIILKKTF